MSKRTKSKMDIRPFEAARRVAIDQAQRAAADALLLALARRGLCPCVCDPSRYESGRCVCGAARAAELLAAVEG